MSDPNGNGVHKPEAPGRLDRWRKLLRRFPLTVVVIALGIGAIAGLPVFDATDYYFSSDAFCGTGCHVLEATVYKEFKASTHGNTRTGVRPTCADCHISAGLTLAMLDHVAGLRDVYAWLIQGIRTPEAFEEVRAETANRVRMRMLNNDSKNCRSCHVMAAIEPERKRGQRQHAEARTEGTTCIVCHYNLVHMDVEPSEAFLEATLQ